MSQVSLWQENIQSAQYAELCDALYERELHILAHANIASVTSLQGRLKSLPYYVRRTALLMTQTESPLALDVQNASWSSKQAKAMPLTGQTPESIWQWYQSIDLVPGLIVPVVVNNRIVIDCVDRVDKEKQRFRTNANGWFDESRVLTAPTPNLLKPNKKVMMAACSGHSWGQAGCCRPIIPSMRELLLSCSINWQNFKKPTPVTRFSS